MYIFSRITGNGDIQWSFSQVKGTLEDDVTEGKFDLRMLSSESSLSFILSISLHTPKCNNELANLDLCVLYKIQNLFDL